MFVFSFKKVINRTLHSYQIFWSSEISAKIYWIQFVFLSFLAWIKWSPTTAIFLLLNNFGILLVLSYFDRLSLISCSSFENMLKLGLCHSFKFTNKIDYFLAQPPRFSFFLFFLRSVSFSLQLHTLNLHEFCWIRSTQSASPARNSLLHLNAFTRDVANISVPQVVRTKMYCEN